MIRRVWYAFIFIVFILVELVISSIKVAAVIIAPRFKLKPGVIAIPIPGDTELEIMVLANLITLTPGTLSLDVSSDKRVLYIHSIHVEDPEALKRSIKRSLEKRVKRIV